MVEIFKHLNFADLLTMTQTCVEYSRVAAHVAKQKYSNRRLIIYGKDMLPLEQGFSISNASAQIRRNAITEDETYISITDCATIIQTFKYLGVYYLRLMDFYGTSNITGKFISDHASDTLKRIEFSKSESIIRYLTKPLVNVKIVDFALAMYYTDSENIPIKRVFPSLEQIHLNAYISSGDFLNHHMPHLYHFQVSATFNSFEQFAPMLRKNQQIRSFQSTVAKHDHLEKINALLPNLEKLALCTFNLGTTEISFESVTTFEAHSSESSPEKLRFPNLERFDLIVGHPNHLGLWIDFLRNHPYLIEFHLLYYNFVLHDFDQLLRQSSSLVEITLFLPKGLSQLGCFQIISTIYSDDFMKSLEGLDKLRVFNLFTHDEIYRAMIRTNCRHMEVNWYITNVTKGVSLERKYTQPLLENLLAE